MKKNLYQDWKSYQLIWIDRLRRDLNHLATDRGEDSNDILSANMNHQIKA